MSVPLPPILRVVAAVGRVPRGALDRLDETRQAVVDRVQLAHAIGRFVVEHERKQVAARLELRRQGSDEVLTVEVDDHNEVLISSAELPGAAAIDTELDVVEGAPHAGELPIAGYESLAAIHVVERLGGLRHDELALVERFERAHRARRTVLAKIEQLGELGTGR